MIPFQRAIWLRLCGAAAIGALAGVGYALGRVLKGKEPALSVIATTFFLWSAILFLIWTYAAWDERARKNRRSTTDDSNKAGIEES